MTTIYFFRHGETDYNKRGIVQGSGIDSSINALGREQARLFFEKYKYIPFDAIWGSELRRTHQTLAGWYGLDREIGRTAALNEINWGIHEGKSPSPEQREDFLHTARRWGEGDLHAKVENGESPIEAWDRSKDFFQEIRQKYPSHTLLMCSHGRQLRVILSQLIDQDLSKMENYSHQNTSLAIVELPVEGPGVLKLHNDLSHLEPESPQANAADGSQ